MGQESVNPLSNPRDRTGAPSGSTWGLVLRQSQMTGGSSHKQPPSTPAAGSRRSEAIPHAVTEGADNPAMTRPDDEDQGDEQPQPLRLPYTANRLQLPDPDAPLTRCPRKDGWSLVNDATGVVIPARCKANLCPYCGPINARLVAGAIGLSRPDRALLLTQVGDDFQTVRNRMKQFVYRLRQEVEDVNLAWHVEPNPKGTGHHGHGWHYGRQKLPQARMSAIAAGLGMGEFVRVNKLRCDPAKPIGYGLKLAGVGYGLKATQAQETITTYLDANGGRMVHATRGYWRDGQGNRFQGQREAMTAWARQLGEDEREGTWLLVRDQDVTKALSGSGKS